MSWLLAWQTWCAVWALGCCVIAYTLDKEDGGRRFDWIDYLTISVWPILLGYEGWKKVSRAVNKRRKEWIT